MSVFTDAKSVFHDFTTAEMTISGRIRILSVYMTPTTSAVTNTMYTVEFQHENSSGDVGMELLLVRSRFPQYLPCLNLPGDGMLFPDGLYVTEPAGNVLESITVVYA